MGVCRRAHARELAHKEWFTITETAAMDSVPLVCKLMFQNESALLESANIDHDELADRLMAIIGMNAVEEHELAGNLELAYVVAMAQPCYRCTWGTTSYAHDGDMPTESRWSAAAGHRSTPCDLGAPPSPCRHS